MKKEGNQKGITIVALVITIIVLLILAGISISTISNQGLIIKAKEAKEKIKNAQVEEENTLSSYLEEINKLNPITMEEAKLNKMLTKTENTLVKDAFGNLFTVPAGFKVMVDSTTTVNKGIVIEDKNNNEFVWIPVGNIYTKADKTENENIEFNRYTFDKNTGEPTPQNDEVIENLYQELETSDKGNTQAKNLNDFKTSVTTKGGFYIGRYEARIESERTKSDPITAPMTEKGTDYVYNWVKQTQAAELARNMYKDATTFTSDLMNSYAWDTATVFLQKCGDNPKYSIKKSVNSGLAKTGTNDITKYTGTKDEQCNVYDIASNCFEWTTETSSGSNAPCVLRGGYGGNNTYNARLRFNLGTSTGNSGSCFRPILYLFN